MDRQLYDEESNPATGVVLDVRSSRVGMFFPSGMDIILTLGTTLSVSVYVPLTLATTGLLGNNNGEILDDWMVSTPSTTPRTLGSRELCIGKFATTKVEAIVQFNNLPATPRATSPKLCIAKFAPTMKTAVLHLNSLPAGTPLRWCCFASVELFGQLASRSTLPHKVQETSPARQENLAGTVWQVYDPWFDTPPLCYPQ